MTRLNQLSRGRRVALLVTVTVILAVVMMLLAEGAVRVRHTLKYGGLWGVEETYTTDPETGLRIPVPGGVFGAVAINSLGFRGPEITVPKPAGSLRLAFLGASTTYCAEVSGNDATWPHLAWRALQDAWPDRDMDYVNAGVPGYGALTSLENLRHRVAALEPDVIVIYHATNDLSHNSFEAAVREGLAVRRTEQELSWPSRYSLLWYLLEKNLRVMRGQARAQDAQGKLDADPDALAAPFERDLARLVEASREVAEVVAVATFAPRLRHAQSPGERAEAASTSMYYMPYMTPDGLLEAFDAYNAAIARVARSSRAVLIAEEASIPGDTRHYVDSVHFTDLGSERMSRRVVNALVDSASFRALVGPPAAAHPAEGRAR